MTDMTMLSPSPILQSESVGELCAAMVPALALLTNLEADGEANYGKFITLGAVIASARSKLGDAGCALIQSPSVSRDSNGMMVDVTTRIIHTSGQWIEGTVSIGVAANTNAQGIGSAITYGRRYGLTAMLGIAVGDEDDDGAGAASSPPAATTIPPERTQRAAKAATEVAEQVAAVAPTDGDDLGNKLGSLATTHPKQNRAVLAARNIAKELSIDPPATWAELLCAPRPLLERVIAGIETHA